jgi:competence protein ComEA
MKSSAEIDAGWELPEDVEQTLFVNAATFEQLCTLPGVGNTRARRIIEWRGKNGPIASLEALLAIDGIGRSTLGRIQAAL